MRLTSILPSLGMMVISFSAFASGGNGSHSPFSLTNRMAFSPPIFSEKNELLVASVAVNSITNPTCYDVNTGSIQVTVSGFAGSGAYTYNIMGTNHLGGAVNATFISSLTTFNFNGLKAGTYTIKVTRGLEMVSTLPQIVKHPPGPMTPTATTTSTLCNGSSDGSITLVGTFPAPGAYGDMSLITSVTYTLTSGPGTPISYVDFGAPFSSPISNPFNGLAAGTYSGTIKLNNCTAASIVNINVAQPAALALSTATSTPALCYDQPSATVTVAAATGGTGAKQYRLFGFNHLGVAVNKPFQASTLFTGLKASNGAGYSIEARDVNLCLSNQISVVVGQAAQLTFSPATVVNHVSCFGGSNGAASFAIAGGTSPYTVNLGGGHTATGVSPVVVGSLPAGSYTASITDANGCVPVGNPSVTITQPTMIAPTSTQVNVFCFGGNNGSIDLSVSGGTPSYTYAWSNGQTTQDISGLTFGTYTVTITDSKFCTKTLTTTITQPTAVGGSMTFTQPLCNGGSTGTATVSVTGGTAAGGIYQVNIGAGNVATNGSGQHTFTGLAAGNYTITITDNNSCTATTSVIITEPTPVAVTNLTSTAESCDYSNDGSLTGTIGGGTPLYSIQISGPSYNLTVPNYPAGSFASGNILQGGTYSFTVTDANGCSTTGSKIVGEPATLAFTSAIGTDPLCNGSSEGFIDIEVAGGTPGYSYNIGGGAVAISGNAATISDLAAGTYFITVTDSHGCTAIESVTLGEPTPISLNLESYLDVSCFGGENGTFQFSLSGGTPDYLFEILRNGDELIPPFTGILPPNPFNWEVIDLDAATWTVLISDANGCVAELEVTILQPDPIEVINVVIENETCDYNDDGRIEFEIQGGTEPYAVVLNPYSGSGIPANTTISTLNDLPAGDYFLLVTDAQGCTFETIFTVTEPDALVLTINSQTDPLCFASSNGSISASATGGTGNFTFELNGVQYDAGLVSTSNGTGNFTGLVAGNYSMTVYDENGCANSIFNIMLNHPDELSIDSYLFEGVNCYGEYQGYGDATPLGGTSEYDFVLLSNPTDVNGFFVVQTYHYPPDAAPGHMFNDLTNGDYTLILTDAHGCTDFEAFSIDFPAQLQLAEDQLQHVDNECFGYSDGQFYVVGTGGLDPYDFYLDGNYFFTGTEVGAAGLAAGIYTMEITDANGCQSAAITIEILDGLEWSIDLTSTPTLCIGSSDGEITVHVNESLDNTGDYYAEVYEWNGLFFNSTGIFLDNQTADFTLTGLPTGQYSVLVSDNGTNCLLLPDENNLVTVGEPAEPVAFSTVLVTEPLCNGGFDGTIFVEGGGGTGPYEYSQNGINFFPDQLLYGYSAGIWDVWVRDANGCTSVQSVFVGEPGQIEVTANVPLHSCNGGELTLTMTGGISPYVIKMVDCNDYNIVLSTVTGVVSEHTFTNLGDNATFCFLVTDFNECGPTPLNVTIPDGQISDPIGYVIAITHVDCHGNGSGEISVMDVTGGSGSFNFTLVFGNDIFTDGPGQDALFSNLVAGNYTLIIEDADLDYPCSVQTSITVVEPATLVAAASATAILCNGGSSTVTVSATGGTLNYSGIGQFSRPAGTHIFTVTDANGCTATTSITISQPSPLVASSSATAILCNGGTATVTISATGGTPNYSGIGQFIRPVGTHVFVVTDANGCAATTSITISQPPLLTVATVGFPVSCFLGTDGSVAANASGGTPFMSGNAYHYLWTTGATTQNVSGLPAGTYSVTVTDSNNCTTTGSATITEPAALILDETHQNVACFGGNTGSINLSVNGGTGAKTFLWSNMATTEDLAGLAAGSYSVTVTDANGCSASLIGIQISQPATALSLSETHVNILCNPQATGSINLTVGGGTPGYSYLWNDGNLNEDRTTIAAGLWQVTVTDENGCLQTLAVTLTQPAAPLTVTELHIHPACAGANTGSIYLTVSGGTGSYSYEWSNGASAQNISGLVANTYSVTVTDENGCSQLLSVQIIDPPALVLSETHVQAGCGGNPIGSIDLTVSGGTPGYTYDWSNDGPDNIDDDTQDLSGLAPGTYTVTVTDAALGGCTSTLTVEITGSPAIVLTANVTIPTCFGGEDGDIDLTVSGGTAPFTYLWNDFQIDEDRINLLANTYTVTVTDSAGCTNSLAITITEPTQVGATVTISALNCATSTGCITVAPNGGTPGWSIQITGQNGGGSGSVSQMGGSVQTCGLPAGSYTIVVTDANGCSFTTTATLSGSSPTVSTTQTNVLCMGAATGSINLTVTGGAPAFTFNWSNGASTEDLSGLAAGSYSVVVTDGNGCTATTSATITEPTMMTLTATSTPSACGNNNGSIQLTVSGGTPGYTFEWNTGETTQNLSNLSGGTYTVVVTDANGCTKIASVTVLQTNPPTASATATNVLCFGQLTGTISASATGGTMPYEFRLNAGVYQPSGLFTGLAAGVYTVEAKDANGCTGTTSATILQPQVALSATTVSTNALCFGQANGTITITAAGGTPGYQYKLGNGSYQNGNVFGSLAAGTYVLTVRDANGCEKSVQATVNQPLPVAATTTLTHVSCFGGSDGQIQVNATGGTPGYEYRLNAGPFQPGNLFTGLAAGTYSITVRDVNGCSTTISATLTQPNGGPLAITVDLILPVSCLLGNNGAIFISVGGCGPFTYTWYKGNNLVGTTQDLVNISAGSYSIFVVDGGGMTASLTNLVVATNTPTIDNLAVENNTSCAVTLKWTAKPNVDGYEVRWRPCGSLTWTMIAVGQVLQHTFTGLLANTCYDFSVRFDSEDCDGDWTNVNALTTPTYNPPINTNASVNSNSSATITWQQAGCGGPAPNFVEVRYKLSSSMVWTVVNLPGTALSHTLNGLAPGSTYQYRLRNRYIVAGVSKYSPYTPTKTFTLPVLLIGNGGGDDRSDFDEPVQTNYNVGENEDVELAGFPNEKGLQIALSPNPATDRTTLRLIRFDAANSLTVRLLSLSGQLLNEQELLDPTGFSELLLDVDNLPQGIYLIEVLNGENREVEKLIKQ